jgi:hypothetical protein
MSASHQLSHSGYCLSPAMPSLCCSSSLLLLLLLLLLAPSGSLAAVRNAKRGFVADGCKSADCQDFALLTSASWFYAYNPADPFSSAGQPSTIHPAFVPMHWCTKGLANASIPPGTNATFLLGFK